jgi:hypothetical protein
MTGAHGAPSHRPRPHASDTERSPRPRRGRRQQRARRRGYLAAAAIVAVFLLAIVLWVRQPDSAPLPKGLADPGTSAPSLLQPTDGASTGPSSSPSGSVSGSATAGATSVPDVLSGALPGSSLVADPNGLPKHSVQIKVTSDGTIAAVGYLVAYGKPSRYKGQFLKSPFVAVTTGRSNGVVAEVGAQAASDATYVTCTITVDGAVRSTHTNHGAYSFAVCVG